jgi:Alternative complex III, ActD subunit
MMPPIYGVVAEFSSLDKLIEAVTAVREAGYTRFEAYTPVPSEELNDAIGYRGSSLPLLIFLGGLFGAIAGYGLQYYCAVIEYPLNVGGRPFHSWPAFIPVTFECTILGAALTAIFGMLALNGLPAPYHPLFHVPRFSRASRDLFFLCLQSRDPKFDRATAADFLANLGSSDVQEVPH